MRSSTTTSSWLADPFRSLCSQLLLRFGDGGKAFVITSALEREGKSTVAANLALALAAAGRRVLLIDGDLRNPSLHTRFSVPNNTGFRDVLEKRCLAAEGATKIAEGAALLPAGASVSNPERTLASPSAAAEIRNLKTAYDFVIIDAPAVLACPDAELLSKNCDGVLLVVGAGKVSDADLRLARQRLQTAGACLLGAILNGVDTPDEQMYSGRTSPAAELAVIDSPSRRTEILPLRSAAESADR